MARKKGNTIKVDLSNWDPNSSGGGGGAFVIPPGNYPVKVESVEQQTSKSSDNEMLVWVFVGNGGKAKGKKFYLYTVFSPEWKLAETMMAVGLEFEPGEVEFDPEEVVGRECIGEVYTDEYNGEKRSKLKKVFLDEEVEETDEAEEEESAPKKKANGKAKVTKLSEDEVKELGEDELEDLLSKHELEIDLSKAKTLTKKRNLVLEALAENDLIA